MRATKQATGGNQFLNRGEEVFVKKIEGGNHADIHWIRPESKSRVITVDQMRELMQEINLKPTEAEYKVAVIVCADRLNVSAANAFLKTLEEPFGRRADDVRVSHRQVVHVGRGIHHAKGPIHRKRVRRGAPLESLRDLYLVDVAGDDMFPRALHVLEEAFLGDVGLHALVAGDFGAYRVRARR